MRLIYILILIITLKSCINFDLSSHKNGYEICEVINAIHKQSPFKIETLSNKCYIQKQLYISGHKSTNIKVPFAYPKDTFECEGLSIVLLEDRKRFEYGGYMYYIDLSIEFLSDDGHKIVVKRFTDELFQRPNTGIGIEFFKTENIYMTKKNNTWAIDSLIQEIQY